MNREFCPECGWHYEEHIFMEGNTLCNMVVLFNDRGDFVGWVPEDEDETQPEREDDIFGLYLQ